MVQQGMQEFNPLPISLVAAMQVAQEAMEQFDREVDYDLLAATKNPATCCYGTCGHLSKRSDQPCGACLDRMTYGY